MSSPSITQYFKSQRKRPRGSLNKEDVAMTTTKKLLLEEGIITAAAGGGSKVFEQPPATSEISKPVVSAAEELATNEKSTPTTKLIKSEKVRKTAGPRRKREQGQQKLSTFLKPKECSAPAQQVVQEKETEKSSDGNGSEDTNPPPPSLDSNTEMEKTTVDKPSEEVSPPAPVEPEKITEQAKEQQAEIPGPAPPPQEVSASPVKFTKIASLSPTKRKKMTTEQVAKILKKKTKLRDLKSALEGINQCSQKLAEFRRTVAEKTAKQSPVKSISPEKPLSISASKRMGVSPAQFYSPSASDRLKIDLERLSASKNPSPSKLVNINNKIKKRLFEEQGSPYEPKEKKTPAYQRFHTLAQKTVEEKGAAVTDEEADLPLPFHFKVLKELFIAVETVVGIMKGRKENIIFPKLRTGVQELFKKVQLREKHLAQMATILPDCYKFQVEKVGLEYHLKLCVEEMPPSVVCARRKAFHSRLIKTCLEQHQKFLLGLVPPIVVPSDKQITRWHPAFKVDEIPDIIPLENVLPVKPAPDKISSARDVIAKAQSILENANPRMKQAVKNMLNSELQSQQQVNTKPKTAANIKALKGVSSSLLEKIRNREREKLLTEMTRSPAESKKLQMAKRLPNYIKVIRNMMVAEKKVALPINSMIDRVTHSTGNKSDVDTEAHLRLLTTLLPNWAKIHKLSHSDVEYIKIDKNVDINHLLLEMDEVIKRLSS